jgi:hypothetical protein
VGRKGAAMINFWIDGTVVVLVVCISFAISLSFWRKAKKSENIRRENENMKREYFKQEGMPVNAKIMNVLMHEDRKQYEVFASWRSRETGRVFNFHEFYMFPMEAEQGFHPNIRRGNTITAWIILDQPSVFIEQDLYV